MQPPAGLPCPPNCQVDNPRCAAVRSANSSSGKNVDDWKFVLQPFIEIEKKERCGQVTKKLNEDEEVWVYTAKDGWLLSGDEGPSEVKAKVWSKKYGGSICVKS